MVEFQVGPWPVNDPIYYGCRETVSNSMLKVFRDSPVLFYETYVTGTTVTPETKALVTGRALHTAILEPDKFRAMFVGRPPGLNLTRNNDKAIFAEFKEKHPGKVVLAEDEWTKVVGIANAVRANQVTHDFIYRGDAQNEKALRWIDLATGIKCRCKYDRGSPSQATIFDIKTTDDPTPGEFARSVVKYEYHVQAPMYIDGFAAAYNLPANKIRFLFLACGKSPPYDVGIYELDALALAQGRRVLERTLSRLSEARATDFWLPGWSCAVTQLGLPPYALDRDLAALQREQNNG